MPMTACGLDGLDWKVVKNMLEVLFKYIDIAILVRYVNPRRHAKDFTEKDFAGLANFAITDMKITQSRR